MPTITETVSDGKRLVSDGAWGTFILQKGLTKQECPEEWNLSHRADILDVAKKYIEAGADLILTNSFGGNEFKLQNYGLSNKVSEINREAAAISREAAGDNHFVMGSMGPTGKMLMMGEVTEEQLYDAFSRQAEALSAGGADAILVETMSDLEEASIAVRAAHDNTDKEVICTMTFEPTKDGAFKSMMGVAPTQVVEPLKEAGAAILGANCGNGSEGMIEITKEFRAVDKQIPLLIHANAGMPRYENGQAVFPESPHDMVAHVPALVEAGAQIIGGCCGTTPDHIRSIAEKVATINRGG
jgi:5-methyltetrahydrofolate--homocysteine methyltransferase